jgi:hypothetical protein
MYYIYVFVFNPHSSIKPTHGHDKIPRLEFRAPSREILAVLLDRLRDLLEQGETRDVVR